MHLLCARAGDVELTDEHIVPFSLGGNATIIDGSCKRCAKETAEIEQEIGRRVLWDFRTHIGEQTRRPKERPKALPFTVSISGKPPEVMTVPIDDHPFFTPMPVWGLPGLMTAAAPTTVFPEYKAHVFYWLPPNIRETIGLAGGELAQLPFPEFRINHEKYARAIAKIAYCQTVVNFGLRGFRRLVLPEIILGRYPLIPYFVGSHLMIRTRRHIQTSNTLFNSAPLPEVDCGSSWRRSVCFRTAARTETVHPRTT